MQGAIGSTDRTDTLAVFQPITAQMLQAFGHVTHEAVTHSDVRKERRIPCPR
jgi:hypothetical protein